MMGRPKQSEKNPNVNEVRCQKHRQKNLEHCQKMESRRKKISRFNAANDPVKNKLRLQKQRVGKRLQQSKRAVPLAAEVL